MKNLTTLFIAIIATFAVACGGAEAEGDGTVAVEGDVTADTSGAENTMDDMNADANAAMDDGNAAMDDGTDAAGDLEAGVDGAADAEVSVDAEAGVE